RCRVDRRTALDVAAEAHEAQIPADAHRTRAELLPHTGRESSLMGKLQGGALAVREERDPHPGHRPAELPRHGERLRPLAAFDDAACVALELIAAADLEVAADRQEPAGNA